MKRLSYLFSIVFTLFTFSVSSQSINQALTATASHSGGGATIYGPQNYNDGVVPATPAGLPWGWVSTNGWIEYTWTTPVSINAIALYKADRPMSTCTMQYWDGSTYVNFLNYNNTVTGFDSVTFPTITTTRLRLDQVAGSSNPNHREIRAWLNISSPNDAAIASVDSPSVFCAGVENVIVTVANYGSTQIDSVEIGWDVNGIPQTTVKYIGLLDTIGGLNPWTAQVTLGTFNFPAGTSNVTAWTMNPNGMMDTTTVNDTLSAPVVTAAPPPPATVSNITLNSAIGSIGNANGIDYVVVPFGNAPASGTPVTMVNSPFNITGLSPSTTYDLYVRKNCGMSNVSAWVGPTTFNTAYAVPYSEDFESFTAGTIQNPYPRGWSTSNTGTAIPRWESEDANNGNNENSTGTGPLWDHTFFGGPTNGMYMYMETSGGTAGDSVDFVSPPILIDTNLTTVEVGYWYFMHGADMNQLKVLVDTNGVENLLATYVGQQQANQTDPWNFDSRFLNGYNGKSVQLIFRGFNASGFTADIAVDDISIDPVLPIDAGVTDVLSPSGSLCPGTVTPVIEVRNFGSTQLNSVKVYWDVNGVLDSLTYTGTVAPGATFPVTLGNISVSAGQIYNVAFYTGDVNGQPDQFAGNNALILAGLRTGVSGTVTLDPAQAASGTNFQSFASLSSTLSNYGVCGNAVVNVANGVYNEFLDLNNVPGLNSANTLTIDGGDSSLTILSHDASTNLATVTLNGVSYVTLRNMTIQATNSSSGVSVLMTGGTNYNTVSNCVLRVSTSSTSTLVTNVTTSANTTSPTATQSGDAMYNTFSNNRLVGGYYGFRLYGNTTLINGIGNRILENDIDSVYYYGVYAYYQDSLEVIGNDVDMLPRGNINAFGTYLYTINNGRVNSNNIVTGDYGLYWSNTNTILRTLNRRNEIINNMVISQNDYGMYIYAVDSVNYWFNSVQTFSTSSPALYLTNIVTSYEMNDWDMRNNILSAASTAALDMNAMTDTIFVKLDNNDYHTATGAVLVDINGTTYADLPSWQAATPLLNANSLEGDPQFQSPTDLHIIGAFVNDSGDASVPITVDIDGEVRPRPSAFSVDIGADEFNPPTCPPPSNQGITNLGSDSVILVWNTVTVGNAIQIEWMPCGTPQGSGTSSFALGNADTLRGLNPASCYEFYIREICGRGDTSVWIGPFSFNTNIQSPQGVNCTVGAPSAIFTDEFDAVGNWTGDVGTGTTAGQWNFGHSGGTGSANTGPSGGAHSGQFYVYMEGSGGTPPATMVSPAIDLSGASGQAELSFWLHMTGTEIGNLDLGVGTSATGPFTSVFSWNGALQPTMASPFQNVGVDLTSYIGQTIYLQFEYTGWVCCASDVAIDLMEINTCVSCPAPDSLVSSNVTLNTVDLDWRENGSATQWEVSYGPNPTAPGAGNSTIVNTNPTTNLTGLTASTTYDWYVRAICGPNDTSSWTGVELFNTANGVPFVEDFETFSAGTFANPWPRGWTSTTTTDPNWESEAGTGANANSVGTGPLWDHTFFGGPQNGIYMYMETSGGTVGDTADFISPPIFIAPSQNVFELSYWYFNHGLNIDKMEVLIDSNGVENLLATYTGQQQANQADPWLKDSILVNGYAGKSVQIIFRGFNVACCSGDIAIDDIALDIVAATDASPIALAEPINDSLQCYTSTENVTVTVFNGGTSALDFTVDPMTVDVNVNGAVTQTLTTTVNTNALNGGLPLASGNSVDVTVGTISMTSTGLYSFEAITSITNDGNTTNDTMLRDITVLPLSGGTISAADTICFGDTTLLNASGYYGSIQWQSYDGTNWNNIAGATGPSVSVSPNNTTDYRVVACGSSNSTIYTLAVINIPAPVVINNIAIVGCDSVGTDTLIATSTFPGVEFNWYDSPTSDSIIQTGDTLLFTDTAKLGAPALDTFYVSASTGGGADSLDASPFVGGNGCGAGNMFDAQSNINLDINAFGINSGVAANTAITVEFWTKTGTYDGFQTNQAAWTLVATVNTISAGPNNVTLVTLPSPFRLNANVLTGMYLNFDADYTNIATGTPYSNADLTITVGDGLCNPFGGVNTGRGWNGRVYYGGGCESPRQWS